VRNVFHVNKLAVASILYRLMMVIVFESFARYVRNPRNFALLAKKDPRLYIYSV